MSLQELAYEARERRLSGNHYDEGEFPLTGYCFDNAFVLHSLLSEEGIESRIVAGLSEDFAEELVRETGVDNISCVEDLAGLVHYWVESQGMVIDIAPYGEQKGDVYISKNLPERYHRLDDSYSYAESVLKGAKISRCSYCGGRKRYCECDHQI
jgi:hypothetical protein